MLKRFLTHLSLVVLFAVTQMGVATHEISHLNEPQQQSQSDKKTAKEACAQCIAYAQIASGLQSSHFVIPSLKSFTELAPHIAESFYASASQPYLARAPPTLA